MTKTQAMLDTKLWTALSASAFDWEPSTTPQRELDLACGKKNPLPDLAELPECQASAMNARNWHQANLLKRFMQAA